MTIKKTKATTQKEIIVETKQDVLNATKDHPNMKWYLLQVDSNSEEAAKRNIMEQLTIIDQLSNVGMIFYPARRVQDIKNGKKVIVKSKNFPGYLFLLVNMNENMLTAIHKANKVMRFVEMEKEKLPKPLNKIDFNKTIEKLDEQQNEVHHKDDWQEKQSVTINAGPFQGNQGVIKKLNFDRQKMSVEILLFGRDTVIDDIDFKDVEAYKD